MGFLKKVKKAVGSVAKVVAPVTNILDGAKLPSGKDFQKNPFGTMASAYSLGSNPWAHFAGEKLGIKGAGGGLFGIALSNFARELDPKRGDVVQGGLPGGAPDPSAAIMGAIEDEKSRMSRRASTLLTSPTRTGSPFTASAKLFGR